MPEVMAIEQSGFPSWSEEEMLRELRKCNVIGMVCERDEKILGYMIYELHKGAIEVLKLAVHPAYRRQGIGSQMVAKLVGKLSNHRRTRITLLTRETNLDGQLFLRSQGFQASNVFRGHYEDSGEDAFVFGYHLRKEAAVVERKGVGA